MHHKLERYTFVILSIMTHHGDLKIIAFVGLPGAGKTSAVEYVTHKGYPKVYFGGVVLDAMTDAGIAHTPDNEKVFREQLRDKGGKDFVVNRIIDQIRQLARIGQRRIVADGLYTWTEYKILKKEFPGKLTVVAVVAPKHLRHHRLSNRPVRPMTGREATERDWAEIENLEKGGPIAIADHYINNDKDLKHLYTQLDQELEHVRFYEN